MAGVHTEKMAQHKYEELMKQRKHFVDDYRYAEEKLDDVMDANYYPGQNKDIDYYINLRNDAQHYLNRVDEEISELLDAFGYCIDLDTPIKEDINESSMSRIYNKLVDDSSCAIISTYRGERSEAENKRLLSELKSIVKKDYGFIEFISRWTETNEDGDIVSSDERSLLIPNISLERSMELSKKYDQASFIYKDETGCREVCSTKFKSWDGVVYTPGDVVRTFNTNVDDRTILNLKDAEEIFAKRKGGPASYIVKGGGQKSFHLSEVLEVSDARPSYFQKDKSYIKIYSK